MYAYIITQEKNEEKHSSEGRIIKKKEKEKNDKLPQATPFPCPLFLSLISIYIYIYFAQVTFKSCYRNRESKSSEMAPYFTCLNNLHRNEILKRLINFSLCFF